MRWRPVAVEVARSSGLLEQAWLRNLARRGQTVPALFQAMVVAFPQQDPKADGFITGLRLKATVRLTTLLCDALM